MSRLTGGLRVGPMAYGVSLTLACAVAGLFLSAWLSGALGLGDGGGDGPQFSASAAVARHRPPWESVVATARHPQIAVYRTSRARLAYRHVRAFEVDRRRAPLVLLVRSTTPGRLNVSLPVRPNGTTGWVRRRDVELAANAYQVTVQLSRHRLVVSRAGRTIGREPIAVGRALTPTPTGRYFITDLVRPNDPGGFFGPYAFGLSAYSPVLTGFAGGSGQVGLHGTNKPSVIGTDVSHGCIRLRNGAIRRLVRTLPLGTPVTIERG